MTLRAERGLIALAISDGCTVVAGEDGSFVFGGLAPGTYALTAHGWVEFHGWVGEVRAGLELGTGAALEGVELRLAEASSNGGSVRAPDGAPIAGATIYVRDGDGALREPHTSSRSDGAGRFTVRVPQGRWTVSARTRAAASLESHALRVTADRTARVELVLEPGTVLRVRTEDAAGAPLRADVSVRDREGREHAWLAGPEVREALLLEGLSATRRRVGPLAPGTYTVEASAGGRRAVRQVVLSGQPERVLRLVLD